MWTKPNEQTSDDVFQRRAEFISKIHSLRQELGDQDPLVFISLVRTYLCSMYGSNLWDLFSVATDKLFTSWNVLLRSTFNLPFPTHRYILYNISNFPHLRVSLLRRFLKFYNILENCQKPEIRHLFMLQKRDCRSVFGRNCLKLCKEFRSISVNEIIPCNITMPISMDPLQKWRIPFLLDLIELRDQGVSADVSQRDIKQIIDYICCN